MAFGVIPNSPPRTPHFWVVWGWGLLLGLLAIAVNAKLLVDADHQMARWMEAVRTPGRDAAAKTMTFFGGSPWTLAAVAAMSLRWWAIHRRAALWACLWAGLGGGILQCLLRLWVGQWRPDTIPPSTMDLAARYELAGFTSGHAFRAAFLYGWWAQALLRRRTWWAATGAIGCGLLIVVVGLTRVYLGRHWVSDVAGGWLVALTALALAKRLEVRFGGGSA